MVKDAEEPGYASLKNNLIAANGEGEKLGLFSFELDPRVDENQRFPRWWCEEQYDKRKSNVDELPNEEKCSEYGCHFCFKEFPSSQAHGDHQSSHRKERMKQQQLEHQAGEAAITYCSLRSPIKTHTSKCACSALWFNNDPSRCVSEFMFSGESHGSLIPRDLIMYFVAQQVCLPPQQILQYQWAERDPTAYHEPNCKMFWIFIWTNNEV